MDNFTSYKPDKRKATDEQLFVDLNNTLRAAKKKITFRVQHPENGYYGQSIRVDFKKNGYRHQPVLYSAFNILDIPRRDILPMLIEEKNKADREVNQTTINQLYTAAFEMAAKLENPIFATSSKTLFFDYIEGLKREAESSGKKPVAEQQLLYQLRATNMRQDVKLKDVSADYIREFLSELEICGLKASSQLHIYSTLRAVLNKAKRDGYIQANPIYNLDQKYKPKYKRTAEEIHYLTTEELKKLYKCYERETNECKKNVLRIFLFQCNTGFRISDVLSLTWANIDFEENQMTIVEQKTKKLMVKTLTSNAKRLLPNANGKGPDDRVFKGCVSEINRTLKKYDKIVGKHLHSHVARHTFATILLQVSGNMSVVQKEMGHTAITTTAIYAQVKDQTRTKEMQKMDKFVSAIY